MTSKQLRRARHSYSDVKQPRHARHS